MEKRISNYDELIAKTDEILSDATLTDTDIDAISETLVENQGPSVQELLDASEEAKNFNGNGISEKGIANIDPATGTIKSVDEIDYYNFEDVTFDDILNDPNIVAKEIDPKDANITKESVMNSLDMFTGDPEKLPLTPMDIDMIISAVNRYKKGEKFAYFNAMPKAVQDIILKLAGPTTLVEMGSLSKHGLNAAVEQFLESCVQEAIMNEHILDLNHSIAQNKEGVTKAIAEGSSTMTNKITDYFEIQMADMAKQMREHGDIDKAAELEEYINAYRQSYTLTNFRRAYDSNKIKIKKIELEKFKRTCESFNLKYSSSKSTIHEISMLKSVLNRHADKKYDMKVIETFIVAFIKYTMNMKPSVLKEHIFMYYFITNILSFDYYDHNNENDQKFHDNLKATINDFLEDIAEKIK